MLAAALTAQPGPGNLIAASATKSEVKLSWSGAAAGGYVIESLGPSRQWKPFGAPLTGASATLPVEPFATYTLRVRATAGGAPSNEITVGPPPVGFHKVLAPPKALAESPSRFAPRLAMTLDDNGDPMFAYAVVDPRNEQVAEHNELWFVSWSRARYKWNDPVRVDVIGDANLGGADWKTHRYALFYVVGRTELRLAVSEDGGAAWKVQSVSKAPADTEFIAPQLAAGDGRFYVAYYQTPDGLHFRGGAQGDAPEKWSTEMVPKMEGTASHGTTALSLAADAEGKPALAYQLLPSDGYNVTLAYWRPGGTPVKAMDSAGAQMDDPSVRLVFQGTSPRIIAYMRRDDEFWQNRRQIWVARSANGSSWEPPAPLPNDGGNAMGAPLSLGFASSGKMAASAQVTGGNNTGTRCGQPKLITAAEPGQWTICAAGATTGSPESDLSNPLLVYAANDKLYIGYVAVSNAKLGPGIHLWREP